MATRRPGYWWGEENDWRGRGNPEAVNRVDLRSERRARQAPLYRRRRRRLAIFIINIHIMLCACDRSFLCVLRMSYLLQPSIVVVFVIIIRQRATCRARRRVEQSKFTRFRRSIGYRIPFFFLLLHVWHCDNIICIPIDTRWRAHFLNNEKQSTLTVQIDAVNKWWHTFMQYR